jgi:hypothetical protein
MANKQRYYFIDTHTGGEKIAIVEKATNAVTIDGFTSNYATVSEVKGFKIRGIFTDTDLVVDALTTTYSNIPSRFHDALVSSVIATGYMDPRNDNPEKASFFTQLYLGGVKSALKFARSNYVSTGRIVPQDF